MLEVLEPYWKKVLEDAGEEYKAYVAYKIFYYLGRWRKKKPCELRIPNILSKEKCDIYYQELENLLQTQCKYRKAKRIILPATNNEAGKK